MFAGVIHEYTFACMFALVCVCVCVNVCMCVCVCVINFLCSHFQSGVVDSARQTPLRLAIQNGKLNVVKYLITEQNIDPKGMYKLEIWRSHTTCACSSPAIC